MITIYNKLKNSYAVLMQLTRASSYANKLFMLIPFFSLLASENIVSSYTLVIFLVVPFVFLHAAGFTYNQICDAYVDSVDKNPITRGSISKSKSMLLLLAFLITSIIFFFLFYTTIVAFLLFAVYIFFWFSYSGLKIRFKETVIGIFVASFVLWSAAPLIILTQFDYFSSTALFLLLFIFLVCASRELHHTLLDYEDDAVKNCKTFAVRVGRTKAIIVKYILYSAGYLCILLNSVFSRNPLLQGLSFLYGTVYFVIVVMEVLSYRLRNGLGFFWVTGNWIKYLNRLYLLIFSVIYLPLSPLIAFLIVWAFFTTEPY